MEYPKVFDRDGHEQTWQWAVDKYGAKFQRADVEAGDPVFQLIELHEKTGHHSLITQVLDGDGQPMADVDVAFYWSGAPDPPEPATEVYPHDWYPNFVHGSTNLNGDVGPGMGKGAYVGVGECGPHSVWIRHPDVLSDLSECHGMIAGTFHDHLDQKFQLKEVRPLPDPDDLEVIDKFAESHDPGMLQLVYPKNMAFDTEGKAGITGSSIDLETSGPHSYIYDDKEWAMVEVCTQHAEAEDREYWLEVCDQLTGKVLTPRVKEVFGGSDHRQVTCVVDWKSATPSPTPSPSPSPPPPTCGWNLDIEHWAKPGTRLLAGEGLPNGTNVTITAPWGSPVTVTAGTKPEWGLGGWEYVCWHAAEYVVGFESCVFSVTVADDGIVVCHFSEGEPPEPQARLVSVAMLFSDAEDLLGELEDEGFGGVFSIENL